MKLCGIDAEDLSRHDRRDRGAQPQAGPRLRPGCRRSRWCPTCWCGAPGAGLAIELNSDTLPRVLVNNRYYAEVSGAARSKEDKDYLAERYQRPTGW